MSRELADGDTTTVQGSGSSIYTLKNVGGAYSCSCPAWRNQGAPAERRTCKHLRAFRGDEAESLRLGSALAGGGSTVRATPGGRNGDSTDATDKAPPLLLAHSWDGVQDLSGYWMSEKLDGVRAYWDGKQLVSRLGNPFVAPSWFLAALPPDLPLDGELFMGRRQFQKAVSVVRQKTPAKEWTEIHYVIFDAPSHGGPFEERLSVLEAAVLAQGASHLKAHTHERCQSVAHLRAELARVEGLGGEGLMLRKPGSRYEVGRSSTLLKVKSFMDAEARVVGHVPGAGRHKGRLGALACELPDGTKFSVGTGLSDEERRNPPSIGAIITFRYQELSTDGVPRFPSYVGVRDDVVFGEGSAKPVGSAGEASRPGHDEAQDASRKAALRERSIAAAKAAFAARRPVR